LNSTSPVFVFLITLLAAGRGLMPAGRAAGVALGLVGVILVIGFESARRGSGATSSRSSPSCWRPCCMPAPRSTAGGSRTLRPA
jgi:drug/metabolite transporter (DMT)-like permease